MKKKQKPKKNNYNKIYKEIGLNSQNEDFYFKFKFFFNKL